MSILGKRKREGTYELRKKKQKVNNEESDLGKWKELHNRCILFFEPNNVQPSSKIAGFDFDSTLVKTKSGRAHPNGPNDWQLWSAKEMKEKLKEKVKEGYRLVIFTNQGGIAKGKQTVREFKIRLNGFMKELCDFPFTVLCAIDYNVFRKPCVGMWDFLKDELQKGVPINMKESFYVGDAAGRRDFKSKAIGKKKQDFSCDDRKFALNLGLSFFTPDMFFFGEKEWKTWIWKGYDIQGQRASLENRIPVHEDSLKRKDRAMEMIINVGFPGSGKSTWSNRVIVGKWGYVRVNLDEMHSHSKCFKVIKEAFSNGKSVVVDNTNPDPASREKYMNLAKQYNAKTRCFHFTTEKQLCEHLNIFRSIMDGAKKVPPIGFGLFNKKFREPTIKEGFESVHKIQFVPFFNGNEKRREKFFQYF